MDQTEIEISFQTDSKITTSIISSVSNNQQFVTHSPEQDPCVNRQKQANENEQDFMR